MSAFTWGAVVNEEEFLSSVCPILNGHIVGLQCPVKGCYWPHITGWGLGEIIAHLNDTHKWPRCKTDVQRRWEDGMEGPSFPTISSFVEEQAVRFGLDLTVRVPSCGS